MPNKFNIAYSNISERDTGRQSGLMMLERAFFIEVRTLDNDYNLNYIKKRVNEEIDKKLKLYNVDFYSDEYLKFSSEIIHTEVMKSIGTILDKKNNYK